MQQLRQLRENTNPAELTRDILRYQNTLTGLTKTPTDQLITEREKHARNKKPNSPPASKPTSPKNFRAQTK